MRVAASCCATAAAWCNNFDPLGMCTDFLTSADAATCVRPSGQRRRHRPSNRNEPPKESFATIGSRPFSLRRLGIAGERQWTRSGVMRGSRSEKVVSQASKCFCCQPLLNPMCCSRVRYVHVTDCTRRESVSKVWPAQVYSKQTSKCNQSHGVGEGLGGSYTQLANTKYTLYTVRQLWQFLMA